MSGPLAGTCLPGWHLDTPTTCIKNTPTTTPVNCAEGTHQDPGTGKCESNSRALPGGGCAEGYYLVAAGNPGLCYPNSKPAPTRGCVVGYHLDSAGAVCIKDTSTKTTTTTPSNEQRCKPGSHQDPKSGQCILTCDHIGYHYDAAKDLCVPDGNSTPAQLPAGTGGDESATGGNKNNTTGQPLSSSSRTTIKIINKNIIEGSQPIGSSSSVPSGDTTGKLFLEFNNRTNAAAGLVVTNTTLTKNQLSGQVDINGQIQNIRPTDTSTTANTNDINTARMIVVVATFYDRANNVVGVQHGEYDPNTLNPGQSSVFHLMVNKVDNNIDHAVYLVQWLGLNGGNGGLLLHPTTQEVNGAAATFPTK